MDYILIDQIRAIDNKRLGKEALVQLDEEFMQMIYQCISEVMGLREI